MWKESLQNKRNRNSTTRLNKSLSIN